MSDVKTESVTRVRIAPKTNIPEPHQYRVVYLNDNVTTMEFVIESLRSVFDYEVDKAMAITQEIHEEGSAVVSILPFEMAEQKGVEVTILARNNGFPLQVKIEPDV
jgi:ATP-dependent Clp protease adaptor protein ClpS